MAFVLFACLSSNKAQNSDSIEIKKIYNEALSNDIAYKKLEYLCKNTAGRICGTPQAAAAVEWAEQKMKELGFDTVYLQPLKVHSWKRGNKETAKMASTLLGDHNLSICALGESIGTGEQGISAQVIEVKNFEELKTLGKEKIKGKIVFFNRAMDPTQIYTFNAYGGAADQRVHGASEAAKYGAIGVIVRSLSESLDDFPHTGIMRYDKDIDTIPAVAVSTLGADLLSNWLKKDKNLILHYTTTCKQFPETNSYNVIGEIKGSEFPNQYIIVGGHIDAWDNGEGAHDDGIGVIQSMEVLRLFKTLNIKPKHTLRAVIFMDEEVAQRGGKKYAELSKLNKETHIAAIESDRGGFTPTGFSIDAPIETVNKLKNNWGKLFEPYGIYQLIKGGSGVDISPLKDQNFPLFGLMTDSQRYFDYQHAASDTFEKVNKREMQMGSAAMAAMIFLIDKYGL
ncbi:MAG: M20/M25/M40 family metallo-hydrolase [Bacteroidetes bacterium]|nr:M20/M25/M40 family metallo-hydrolase [Bacteroidota bacterium]